jgi:hypothetical protein
MNNEEILQKTLSMTIERLGKQAVSYESEIANLNAQILVMMSQHEDSGYATKTAEDVS